MWDFNWHLSRLPSGAGQRGLLGCCVLGSQAPRAAIDAGHPYWKSKGLPGVQPCSCSPSLPGSSAAGFGVGSPEVLRSTQCQLQHVLASRSPLHVVLGWALQTGGFYEGENLQILAIFVKLSVVCFKQQCLCSCKELSCASSSQITRYLPWPWALPGPGLMPLPSWGVQTQRGLRCVLRRYLGPHPNL